MPALIPSNSYGMLLPYSSAAMLSDGSLRESKHGLVTVNGVVVTDLVYDRVDRAQSYQSGIYTPRPAYRLAVNIPGSDSQWGFVQTRQAACALDGSWVTPFDFIDMVFTEDVMILIRDYETYDFLVYDYEGRFIYNFMDLDWIGSVYRDAWPGNFVHNISEGYGAVQMNDGTFAFVDILQGWPMYTEFVSAQPFSEDLAAVKVRMSSFGETTELWGFLDRGFGMVIPPRFVDATVFMHGRAVGSMPDGTWQLIDKQGKILMSVPSYNYLEPHYDGSGYTVHSFEGQRGPTFYPKYYTFDLVGVAPPAAAVPEGRDANIFSLDGDWFGLISGGGVWVFTPYEEHFFPDTSYVSYIDGEFVIYSLHDGQSGLMGVKTMDGRDMIPPMKNAIISAVVVDGSLAAFIENIGNMGYFIRPGSSYMPSEYRLIGVDGSVITAGSGRLTHDESTGFFSVLAADHFAWLDKNGNVMISIPLMSYALD